MLYHRLSFLVLALSITLFAGCAQQIGEGNNAFDHFLNEDVDMLVISPGQTEASETDTREITLHKGSRVRQVERGGTTTLIETMKGERGRVPTIDLEETDPNDTGEPQAKMGKTIKW